MSVEVTVPAGGESIVEVLIAEWLKSEGDPVRQDEPLVTLETDKATLDLPAPAAGVLARILKPRGQMARVGEVIAVLEEAAAGVSAAAGAVPPRAEREREPEARPAPEPRATPRPGVVPTPSARPTPSATPAAETPREMPSARVPVAEETPRPEPVTPAGRPREKEVLLDVDIPRAAPADAAVPPRTEAPSPAIADRRPAGPREEDVVPMSMLRRRVAERLVQAQQTAALLTTFNEIDMSAISALRRTHQEAFEQRYQVRLGIMSFFVKAVIEALKRIPELNAEIRGTDIVYRNYHDIGVAVGSGRGLVVPVLRDADRLSFAETERAVADLARRAQANQLGLDELQGGTFTISNGGVYGSLLSTPIVNPPQSGILGLHVIQDRPVARDGQVVVRPMMYVALTYDHRIVDGREAVTFLRHVKACAEEPARILLEV
jgi:2-oxoglutarate dehydrogenase E2 component (dihydrolipoamide succinyltransferase)